MLGVHEIYIALCYSPYVDYVNIPPISHRHPEKLALDGIGPNRYSTLNGLVLPSGSDLGRLERSGLRLLGRLELRLLRWEDHRLLWKLAGEGGGK
jgi:hypothetical protein